MESAPEAAAPEAAEASSVEERTPDRESDDNQYEASPDNKQQGDSKPKPRPKRKLKVDGEELEVDDDELVKGYQNSRSSTKRFQEAARLRKEAEQMKAEAEAFQKALAEGDLRSLEKKFPDLRKSTEKYLLEHLEYDQLPDHEKELRRLRSELDEERASKKAEAEAREKEQYEQMLSEAEGEVDKEISEALSQASYKASPQFVQVMIDAMKAPLLAMRDGQEATRLSGEDAFKMADKWGQDFVGNYLENIPVEQAVQRVPKAVLEHYRKQHLKSVTSNLPTRRAQSTEGTAPVQKPKRKSFDEFFKEL